MDSEDIAAVQAFMRRPFWVKWLLVICLLIKALLKSMVDALFFGIILALGLSSVVWVFGGPAQEIARMLIVAFGCLFTIVFFALRVTRRI